MKILLILYKKEENVSKKLTYSEKWQILLIIMIALEYINKIEPETEKQFSAITVILPDNTIYVSYRGTDNTLIGWKEDFNMSFKSHIASQISAKEYLENIAKKYPNKKIRIGGHSKGGNLAVYASIFADSEVKKRIINVYNNDGPGFNEDIINTEESVALALLAAEEAKLAFLEAAEAQKEYDEKYGEE